MTKTALIVMADGFEDIEAVAPIDVLTRVGVKVTIAGLLDQPIQGAYGTKLVPHTSLDKVTGLFDAIIFPGGTKNAQSLAADQNAIRMAREHFARGRIVAAICAAPSHVLGEAAGVLHGRRATGDPGFNDKLAASGAIVTNERVTDDRRIITGMGPGAAMHFALMLAERLGFKTRADEFAANWGIDRTP